MGNIIQFPRKEYTVLARREEYIEHFIHALCVVAHELDVDLEEFSDETTEIYGALSSIINTHLGLYENFGEGFGESDEEVQENLERETS